MALPRSPRVRILRTRRSSSRPRGQRGRRGPVRRLFGTWLVDWDGRAESLPHRRDIDGIELYFSNLVPIPGSLYLGHLNDTAQYIWCESSSLLRRFVAFDSVAAPTIQSQSRLRRTSRTPRSRWTSSSRSCLVRRITSSSVRCASSSSRSQRNRSNASICAG